MGAAEELATLHPELGEQKMDFLERIAKGVRPLSAGLAVGWTPKRTREVLTEPGMAEIVRDAQEISIETLEEKVYKLAKKGNVSCLQLVLFCQASERGWRPATQRVAISSQSTVRVEVVEAAKAATLAAISKHGVKALQVGGALDVVDAEPLDD